MQSVHINTNAVSMNPIQARCTQYNIVSFIGGGNWSTRIGEDHRPVVNN
jgi:hypothetical protein